MTNNKKTNRDVYNNEEYKSWALMSGLILEENIIVERYLKDKNAKIMEAGGGGRILFELYNKGYQNLHGFDNAEKLLNAVISKNEQKKSGINFSFQDAAKLDYPSGSFDQVLYLQQMICFIEKSLDRDRAVAEACRVLKPGGTAFFSLLHFDGRRYNYPLAFLCAFLRKARGEKDVIAKFRSLPWLKKGQKINLSFWKREEPSNYWFTLGEALYLLIKNGFAVEKFFTQKMARSNAFGVYIPGGMIYVAARKK